MNGREDSEQAVAKIVQELLLAEDDRRAVTPGLIAEKVAMVIQLNPRWREEVNAEAVAAEVIRRFSVWIGQDGTLGNGTGHEAWLVAARQQDWRYWKRYREYLERSLPSSAIDALDRSTDSVLGLLEDPRRGGAWDRRGLVVGHVQSGKTAHYSGLICKAADAGYKIIVVLAGLHNNLRSQTQARLDEGFLGYETSPTGVPGMPIGVGVYDPDQAINPNCATNRSNGGDFGRRIARHLAVSPEQRPWLFVVKKNKSVLRELLRWIQERAADVALGVEGPARDPDGLPRVVRRVSQLPLLVIDDEADHASVDTEEQAFDDEGRPADDHQPKTINRLIRRTLHSFSRCAYVGYTATPFANIFIHEKGATEQEGRDLFPEAFICNLAAPSDYVGPAKAFGLRSSPTAERPLVRKVKDADGADGTLSWMPRNHKKDHYPRFQGEGCIPPSLEEAILAFVLATAARKLRGQGHRHSSMLVHVTRFTSVQLVVHGQVEGALRRLQRRLARRIDHEATLASMEALWADDFARTSNGLGADLPAWSAIAEVLADVAADIQVRTINGSAKDSLDYIEHRNTGLKVIAIGGDKLARGLTLEGLCTSYFLRASKMYDTLMQMGRWFGYRPGYEDLCRLYTTDELVEWFGHITDAAEELREEFDLMVASGATPRDFGFRVQSHPTLMVTSPLKMRTARDLQISFSGQLLETVALPRTGSDLTANLENTRRLLAGLGEPGERDPKRLRNGATQEWKAALWHGVPGNVVVDFLAAYRTHPEAIRVNSRMVAEFVDLMVRQGELTTWTVGVIGGGSGPNINLRDDVGVTMLKRHHESESATRYSIGRLMSPRDEGIDLDEGAWNAALEITRQAWQADPARLQKKEPELPSGVAIRRVKGQGAANVAARPDKGTLFLYPLDPEQAGIAFSEEVTAVMGLALSFPTSQTAPTVQYKVSNVEWQQEFGPAQ